MQRMSLYLIGDLQGCYTPLRRLLEKIGFSASRDTLYCLGDLVNRGPDSLGVLRHLAGLGDAAQCLLGNHDLHLLALWQGVRLPGRRDTAQSVLAAPDAPALMNWLRQRVMALHAHGWLMVHAGVLPGWSTAQTLLLASEVQDVLRSDGLRAFLLAMYGDTPVQWHDELTGADRLRVVVNALTRLRFCSPQGAMELTRSDSADGAPAGLMPWFDAPGRQTRGTPIAFGHWSTLSKHRKPETIALHNGTLALDTGCVWGGSLTAARLHGAAGEFELISTPCCQAQRF